MEILGEIFFEIVGEIAVSIANSIAETVGDRLTFRSSAIRKTIAVLIGLATGMVIIALGFFSVLLFLAQHPIAGCLVAITTFFFIVLLISVIVKLNTIKKDKSHKNK